MIKINHEQYDKVTGAVDSRGIRPSKDGMPVEGDVDIPEIYSCQTRVSFICLIKSFQRCKS